VSAREILEQKVTYTLERLLCAGGMADVYEAHHLGVNGFRKRVALKFLRPEVAQHTDLLDNFVGEAKLVADLIHTNIVQIYDLGYHEGRFFIAMELIDGVTLSQLCAQHEDLGRHLPFEMAVFIVSRVARGLAYAHETRAPDGRPLGLVHRDVNPANVMMSFEGDVKLVDFGVAKAKFYMADHEERMIAGKVDYMSPEQIDFQKTDFRSDIFSSCVVLAQLLTGKKLFAATSAAEARRQIHAFEVGSLFRAHPEVFQDERLKDILRLGLAQRPADRYGATRDLLVDLERLIYSGGYGPTNETLAAYLQSLFPRRAAGRPVGGEDRTVIVE
jgi:serine/threonine-protein kinase